MKKIKTCACCKGEIKITFKRHYGEKYRSLKFLTNSFVSKCKCRVIHTDVYNRENIFDKEDVFDKEKLRKHEKKSIKLIHDSFKNKPDFNEIGRFNFSDSILSNWGEARDITEQLEGFTTYYYYNHKSFVNDMFIIDNKYYLTKNIELKGLGKMLLAIHVGKKIINNHANVLVKLEDSSIYFKLKAKKTKNHPYGFVIINEYINISRAIVFLSNLPTHIVFSNDKLLYAKYTV